MKAKPTSIQSNYSDFFTPMYSAIAADCFEAVKALVKGGYDINKIKAHTTLLTYIANNADRPNTNTTKIMEYLLECKAHIAPNDIYAAAHHHELIALLLKHKADVNAYHTDAEATPLHAAAFKPSLEAVHLLLKSNANIHATNRLGLTPLQDVQSVIKGFKEEKNDISSYRYEWVKKRVEELEKIEALLIEAAKSTELTSDVVISSSNQISSD